MSITDLMTQIEVAPGLPGALSDTAQGQRGAGKTPPNTDYRDKLARTLNEPAPAETKPREKPTAESSPDSGTSARSAAPRETNAGLRPAQPKGASSKPSPSTESAGTPESTAKPADTTQVNDDPQAQGAETGITAPPIGKSSEAPEIEIEIEEPSAEEISRTALALLTITTAPPAIVVADFDAPEAPQGLYQLLQTGPTESTNVPQLQACENQEGRVLPPTGLLEAFGIPNTAVADVSARDDAEQSTVQDATKSIATSFTPESGIEFEVVTVTPTSDIATAEPVVSESTPSALPVVTTITAGTVITSTDVNSSKNLNADEDAADLTPSSFRYDDVPHSDVPRSEAKVSQQQVSATPNSQPTSQTPEHAQAQKPNVTVVAQTTTTTVADSGSSQETETSTGDDDLQARGRPQELFSGKDNGATRELGTIVTTSDSIDGHSPDGDGVNPLAAAPRSETTAATHRVQHTASMTKVDAQELVEQVSSAVRFAGETGRALRVRLHPPELGVLQIEISSRDGQLTARLETQTVSAHQAIVENLSSLREALAHTGAHVERIEVHVSENRGSDGLSQHPDRQEDEAQQQNSQQQRRQREAQQEQEREAEAAIVTAGNAIDQLDIQI